jgi:FkbM family methyltransferase
VIPDLIYDVGMHRGEDSEFYLSKGFRVVAVEANPELCDEVSRRLAPSVAGGQLTIVNAAIVDCPGPVTFYACDEISDWGTVRDDWVERNAAMGASAREITVEGVRFGDVLARHGVPYFLKIDIEGNDMLCLDGLLGLSDVPRYISIESEKVSWQALVREFDVLNRLGYSQFKVVNQTSVGDQICPNPPREGEYVSHHFRFGSSGLFGEEAPGRWKSRGMALLHYRWIFAKYRAVGNYGIFPNLHRRFPAGHRLKKLLHPGWYDTHASRPSPAAGSNGGLSS